MPRNILELSQGEIGIDGDDNPARFRDRKKATTNSMEFAMQMSTGSPFLTPRLTQ